MLVGVKTGVLRVPDQEINWGSVWIFYLFVLFFVGIITEVYTESP